MAGKKKGKLGAKAQMIIFLDIDEVLVDFVNPAIEAHGLDHDKVYDLWSMDEWSLHKNLGMPDSKFWQPIIEAGPEFWENLPEKPWIDEMLYLVSSKVAATYDECYLVSSPNKCVTSYTGKVRWIRKRFGGGFDKFILTPHKHLLAAEDRLLIDDNPYNCERFIKQGGQAILFPFWGNRNRKYLEDPIGFVKRQLHAKTRVEQT
jgi:5'(3')-deoxyribonucleotidase